MDEQNTPEVKAEKSEAQKALDLAIRHVKTVPSTVNIEELNAAVEAYRNEWLRKNFA